MALATLDCVPGFAHADYSARMCVTCAACGSAAVDDGRDYCRKCQHVVTLISAWGAPEIVRRVWLVAPTLPGVDVPPTSLEGLAP